LNKEPFARALMMLKWLYPKEFTFDPDTYIYPEMSEKLQAHIDENPNTYYIVKPSSTSCGFGITLASKYYFFNLFFKFPLN
jgi:hypothetical protein